MSRERIPRHCVAMAMQRPGHTEIAFRAMKFLITDKPTDLGLDEYVRELKQRKVSDVVRVCEGDYSTTPLHDEGIRVHDWFFEDGTLPPDHVTQQWFQLLTKRFAEEPDCCVAVHCVAGLGRAPVLVALALIELGMEFADAVELIRRRRRGAINAKQLAYLASYKPKNRLRLRRRAKCDIT